MQLVWKLKVLAVWPQVEGGLVQVTSKLVQAAEALLRGALEPLIMFAHAKGQHITLASQASPRKGAAHL